MQVKNVLFDLDGTLIDSSQGIFSSINYAMKKMNHPLLSQELLKSFIGPPLLDSFVRIGFSNEKAIEAVQYYRENYHHFGMYQVKPYPEIEKVLNRLSSTHHLYLTTSKPEYFAVKILQHLNFTSFISGVYGADLEGKLSQKADVIHYALTNESILVTETLMVGDREHDIKGANENGIDGLGVLYGFGDKKELLDAGAICTVERPIDLLEIFEN